MIIKLSKELNNKGEYDLISFTMNDAIDSVNVSTFETEKKKIYETDSYYYYYLKGAVDIDECQKFKVKSRKGDIVSITARDNSYIVFPSKKAFMYAFNLDYNKVLNMEYIEVLMDGKPYEVKYVKDRDDKTDDGVVYTLAQLITYVSALIRGYTYRLANDFSKKEDRVNRILNKWYTRRTLEFGKQFELNVKKVWQTEDGKWQKRVYCNCTKSNRYMYDYYILRMFAYMILTKSKNDMINDTEPQYCFNETFNTLDEVYEFIEDHQDIVNNLFVELPTLFQKPNDMYTSYAPTIPGVYMFYDYNNVKVYLYRNIDQQKFDNKSLKCTYVSNRYKHKIKAIKSSYCIQ